MIKLKIPSLISTLALSSLLFGNMSLPLLADPRDEDEEAQAAPIRLLHTEMMVEIFRFLDARSLARAAVVSQEWSRLSQDEFLWNDLLQKLNFQKPNESTHPKTIVIASLQKSVVNPIIMGPISYDQNDGFLNLGYAQAKSRKFEGKNEDKNASHELLSSYINSEFGLQMRFLNSRLGRNWKANSGCHDYLYNQNVDSYRKFYFSSEREATVTANEEKVALNDPEAIRRKIVGLAEGMHGYEKTPEAAKTLNEKLVAQGDPESIRRAVMGHAFGDYGYDKDPEYIDRYLRILGAFTAK